MSNAWPGQFTDDQRPAPSVDVSVLPPAPTLTLDQYRRASLTVAGRCTDLVLPPELLEQIESGAFVHTDRWGRRRRDVPAGKWSGKP